MRKQQIYICSLIFFLLWMASSSLSLAASSPADNNAKVDLRILETTDLHSYLFNYDYYQSKTDNRVGLVKTATLIHQARKEVKNSLLFDNGDHLKGNPLGEFLARIKGIHKGKAHPVYRAFNFLGYDAITIGNHEFNYGVNFLHAALKGVKMPVVNANVYSIQNKPYFTPYVILKRTVMDRQGKSQQLNIGVIGFMPPQIMKWDKANLEGKVFARPIVEAAKEYVPIMKEKGADIIIALAHTGISSSPYTQETENAAFYLTMIPGIDAILAGHSHAVFPGPVYSHLPNTNLVTGEINGKPVVMAGSFGSRLGIIDLELEKTAGLWKVVKGSSTTRPIADHNGNSLVKTDTALSRYIWKEHQETVNFIKKLGL